jgi:hypothetical protein
MARGTRFVAFKIPQGGHSVIAAVTSASLLLVGAAVSTLVLEMPLTQALAATARAETSTPAGAAPEGTAEATRAKLARCACDRWRKSTATAADTPCAVDELVVSRDLVVARLNLHPGQAVEVMHLIDGHVDEDWHLASAHAWR